MTKELDAHLAKVVGEVAKTKTKTRNIGWAKRPWEKAYPQRR